MSDRHDASAMGERTDLPEPVQWHEGMMLAPQHFQQQDLRQDRVLHYHLQQALPYHWGVVHLLLDRVALVSGTFRVLELEAVMPDGLVVRHRTGDAHGLDLDLTEHLPAAADAAITVHLAVPVLKAGGSASGQLSRYRSVEGTPVADEATGEGELRIPRLRPRLSLLATLGPNQRPPQKYVTLPLAELAYQSDAFVLTGYLPPALGVPEDSALGRLCADLARRMREKALFLIERLGAAGDADAPLMRSKVFEVQGLVAGLPVLEALLGSGRTHPFALYLALCAMVGQVAASGSIALPPVLGRYDHSNALASFSEVRDYLNRSLDQVRESVRGIPFAFENEKFTLVMQPAWLERKLTLAVRLSVSMTEADVVAWFTNSLIASRSKVETLWEMRVMGATRRVVEGAPELDIARSRGAVLFEVDSDARFILPNEPLEVWNADGRTARRRPLEVVLYVRSGND